MCQNVLLFIHLKMFKTGCMLNIINCNKTCVACCSVWHRTTTEYSYGSHLARSVGFLQLTAQWCGLVVMCNVQHIVTDHTASQISQERRAALPSPLTGGWFHMCSFKKSITHSHPVNVIFSYLCPLFLHTFWLSAMYKTIMLMSKWCMQNADILTKSPAYMYRQSMTHCPKYFTATYKTNYEYTVATFQQGETKPLC